MGGEKKAKNVLPKITIYKKGSKVVSDKKPASKGVEKDESKGKSK